MFAKQVGNELKSIRIRRNLTLEEASEIIGIHKNTLSIYENNAYTLKIGKLYEILTKYNIDADIFFKNVCEYIRDSTSNDLIQELEEE